MHTPGVKTIEGLAEFLGVPTSKTLKAVFYMGGEELVIVTIRGDLDVNEVKLRNVLGGSEVRLASAEEVQRAGLVAGSASAVGLSGVRTVADDSIHVGSNFVVGANKPDYHLRNANHPRDFQADVIADIALAQVGYACPRCESILVARRGIEVGHVFKMGTRYSEVMGASFPDQDGAHHPIIMGCYGIGVGRLLAAAVEQNHDDKGMVFPAAIAPYQVWLMALNVEREEVAQAAEALYQRLNEEGVQVLYDDRQESAGVKFNDADLLGFPVRVVVSPRNLKQNVVEIKLRSDSDAATAPQEQAVDRIKQLLA